MLLAFDVDVVAIAEVISFSTASYVDETVYGPALAEDFADVLFGLVQRNLGSDDQFDIEVLRVDELFLGVCHYSGLWIAKIVIFALNTVLFSLNGEIFLMETIFVVLLCFEIKTDEMILRLWLSIKVFIKGMIMGAVNVFPVSSATVSLILGVFERFVNAIKALNHKNFKYFHRGQFGEFARRTDIKFLVTIIFGLLAGMILTAIFLKQTLKSYEVFTWSFFIGLIMASVVYVAKRIEKRNVKNLLLFAVGMAVSFMLSIKSNPYSNDNFFYLFLCGIIGATGMVVPGLSGSHLMLLMGNYELIVTDAIPSLAKASTFLHGASILLPFVLGALVSIVSFSHLLSWLLRDYKDSTLSVLAGFMLGSLPVVYPWKTPSSDMMDYVFHLPSWNRELLMALVMMSLGALSVYLLELMARHTEKKQAERLQNPKPNKHGTKTKQNYLHTS